MPRRAELRAVARTTGDSPSAAGAGARRSPHARTSPLRLLRSARLTLLLALAPAALGGQQAPLPEPGSGPGSDGLMVYLLTMGPGDAVWELFGHNAIWLRDPAAGIDVAYNWGMFSFEQPGFIARLAKGTMLYWMAGYPADATIRAYAAANRDVWVQELALTQAQRLELATLLRHTDTDAHRFYPYDYYRDNCSTRVRDALDQVLGGRLREALDSVPTGVTWRWHARRILRAMPAAYAGMEVALGSPADEPINAWQEGFLPLRLRDHLKAVTVLDSDGRAQPLVTREFQLMEAVRGPGPEGPPLWLPWFGAAGLALAAAIVAAVSLAAGGGRGAWIGRGVAAALAGAWSLTAGSAGVLLVLAWLFTDHVFWYRNENLLQLSPLSLCLLPPFALLLAARPIGRPGFLLAVAVLAVSVLGALLQTLPWLDQINGEVIAFALPVHAAVAWAAARLGGSAGQGAR